MKIVVEEKGKTMGWLFAPKPTMVSEEDALAGSSQVVLSNPQPHEVLGTPITGPWKPGQRRLWVGLGCFWGVEKLLWNFPGVESTSVGFAGGFTTNPTYRQVCTGKTGHAEVVEVVYNPEVTSLGKLVAACLEAHDPTQGYGQGNDVGTQYRSVFFTETDEEATTVSGIVSRYGQTLKEHGFGPITTEVKVLDPQEYYRAEEYHQQYLAKNPEGYCPSHATGVPCGPESS